MVMDGDAMAAAANTKARAKIVADAFPTMEFVNDVWCVHLQLHPPVRILANVFSRMVVVCVYVTGTTSARELPRWARLERPGWKG